MMSIDDVVKVGMNPNEVTRALAKILEGCIAQDDLHIFAENIASYHSSTRIITVAVFKLVPDLRLGDFVSNLGAVSLCVSNARRFYGSRTPFEIVDYSEQVSAALEHLSTLKNYSDFISKSFTQCVYGACARYGLEVFDRRNSDIFSEYTPIEFIAIGSKLGNHLESTFQAIVEAYHHIDELVEHDLFKKNLKSEVVYLERK